MEPKINKSELVDSHCHFDFPDFDADRQEIWESCQQLGIVQLLIPGTCPNQWSRANAICSQIPSLVYSAGLHPWWIEETPIDAETLINAIKNELKNPRCVAIGECGLDSTIDTSSTMQLSVLENQIALAEQMQVPIILHCVKAHNSMLQILKRYRLSAGGVIHAYSGSYEQAMQYWDMGFYLGIGGTITYLRANKTRDAAKRLPLEALLLESDAPDMPIYGYQGQRNSPEKIFEIAKTLSALREDSIQKIKHQTSANFRKLFRQNFPLHGPNATENH